MKNMERMEIIRELNKIGNDLSDMRTFHSLNSANKKLIEKNEYVIYNDISNWLFTTELNCTMIKTKEYPNVENLPAKFTHLKKYVIIHILQNNIPIIIDDNGNCFYFKNCNYFIFKNKIACIKNSLSENWNEFKNRKKIDDFITKIWNKK